MSFAGGFQQATLCGSLGVAAAAIGMVADEKLQKQLVSDLIRWYKDFPFPKYQPAGLNLTTTVSKSELCRDSVGKWMEATGIAYDDPKRKERCAGLTADVASRVVELLNEHLGKQV
ncbi:MAG: hypothetical protein PWP58_1198 [Bacillota bacterium]|nr:hypothetical protein [Bacillota bacterium]